MGVLLKRGDYENAAKAASAGILRCLDKLPKDWPERTAFRIKLHYRRGLARGEPGPGRDIEGAKEVLAKAASLDPTNKEIRTCFENCKEIIRKEKEEKEEAARKEKEEKEEAARREKELAQKDKEAKEKKAERDFARRAVNQDS